MWILVNFFIYIIVNFSCVWICWMIHNCKNIISLCVILLSSHSFGCWRALDVCHDILITTFPFLGQQKCFCYNFADTKMKFFLVTKARGGVVFLCGSQCQVVNKKIKCKDTIEDKRKFISAWKSLKINFPLMSQFRPCNFGKDYVRLKIAVIELEKKNDNNGG